MDALPTHFVKFIVNKLPFATSISSASLRLKYLIIGPDLVENKILTKSF